MGGIGHPGRAYLGRLANLGDPNRIGSRDSTVYTTCWTAPSFAAHHGMCISAQCVYADALLLSLGAMRMKTARATTIGNIADRPSAILPIAHVRA